jgi:hypothetical protein
MDTRRTATATAGRAARPALDTAPRHPAPYGLSVPVGPNEPLPLNAPGGPKSDGGLPKPPPAGGVKLVGGVVPTAGGLNSGLEPAGGVKPPAGGAKLVGGVAPTGGVKPVGGVVLIAGGLEPAGGVKPPAGGATLGCGVAPTGVLELEPPAAELHTCQ